MTSTPPPDVPATSPASREKLIESWVTSLTVHGVLLLLMALIVLSPPVETPREVVVIQTEAKDPAPFDRMDELNRLSPSTIETLNPQMVATLPDTALPEDIPAAAQMNQTQQEMQWLLEAEQFLGRPHQPGGFEGRMGTARGALARASGGTAGSEAAVKEGLEWLVRHQQTDGSWNFAHRTSQCDGTCTEEGSEKSATLAATAMALLCFAGAGHTHQTGDYQEEFTKGLKFLTQHAEQASIPGDFRQLPDNSGMYAQGLVTMLFSEVYGLTHDRNIGRYAQLGVRFIEKAQSPRTGGWRYTPRSYSADTSVAGWMIMSLTSAHLARLSVNPQSQRLATKFLNSVELSDGAFYGYTGPQKTPSTTAIGLLCRMYYGWHQRQPALREGVLYLSEMGPSLDNMYYNYYATQVLHHWGGDEWQRWNHVMREQLINTQEHSGHSAGSWTPRDPHSYAGGRHYMTCLAILTLEVYYRHLPLYQENFLPGPANADE